MIGSGYGHLDLPFVKGCMPNVERFAAVEPDADQMAKMRTNVAEQLPNASVEFFQETAQDWKGCDGERFDVVLLFHCLYYVPALKRDDLYRKLFDGVVATGGLVCILISPCNLEEPTTLCRLLGLTTAERYLDGNRVGAKMAEAGFREHYTTSMDCHLDVAEPNDDIMKGMSRSTGGRMTPEAIREKLHELIGSDRYLPDTMFFGVYVKP